MVLVAVMSKHFIHMVAGFKAAVELRVLDEKC
jgi:hypothetical protein